MDSPPTLASKRTLFSGAYSDPIGTDVEKSGSSPLVSPTPGTTVPGCLVRPNLPRNHTIGLNSTKIFVPISADTPDLAA